MLEMRKPSAASQVTWMVISNLIIKDGYLPDLLKHFR
jgi:hypothetical protein